MVNNTIYIVRDYDPQTELSYWTTAEKAEEALRLYRKHRMVGPHGEVVAVTLNEDEFTARHKEK